MNILVDCDGVLANFVKASLAAHGRRETEADCRRYDYYLDWPISTTQFLSKVRGYDFWFGMEEYPWARELLRRIGDYTISTKPSVDRECGVGKFDWLRQRGVKIGDVMVGRKKWLMAPGSLLIDDHEMNCVEFRAAGGKAIVFPQPWNEDGRAGKTWLDVLDELSLYRRQA